MRVRIHGALADGLGLLERDYSAAKLSKLTIATASARRPSTN